MSADDDTTRALQALRLAFDEPFQRPLPDAAAADSHEGLLLVSVGSHRLALPIRETSAVHRCPPITPVPSGQPSLLGLVGLHGTVVSVHGLGRLLGFPETTPGGWLVVAAAGRSVAVVVDEVSGLVRLPAAAIASGMVAIGSDRRTVVSLGAVLERVGARQGE